MTTRPWPTLAALLICLTAVACEGREEETSNGDRHAPEVPGAPSTLAPIDHSGVTGTVVADGKTGRIEVELTIEGLEPRSAYRAHFHPGRCAASVSTGGPLGVIEPEEDGTARARFEVAAAELPPDQDWSVQVETADGEAVACATMARQ
jgi:hypothetical protein